MEFWKRFNIYGTHIIEVYVIIVYIYNYIHTREFRRDLESVPIFSPIPENLMRGKFFEY